MHQATINCTEKKELLALFSQSRSYHNRRRFRIENYHHLMGVLFLTRKRFCVAVTSLMLHFHHAMEERNSKRAKLTVYQSSPENTFALGVFSCKLSRVRTQHLIRRQSKSGYGEQKRPDMERLRKKTH